jgi:precorrin-2 dehydrogenase/sirohydrochlorin ferrochelatase
MERLFPLFLKLKGRKCLVVGAGAIGQSKIASLLDAGAGVQVVAPSATAKIQGWARKGQIRWRKREFRDADLANCFLVVAATSSSKLHKKMFRLAKRRGVLCNVVDVPKLCDFYYPAVVRRGLCKSLFQRGEQARRLYNALGRNSKHNLVRSMEIGSQNLGRCDREFSMAQRRLRIKKHSCTN